VIDTDLYTFDGLNIFSTSRLMKYLKRLKFGFETSAIWRIRSNLKFQIWLILI